LADEVAMECRRAGAETETLYISDRVWYWSLRELPMNWLRGESKTHLALLDVATAMIWLEAPADPKPMAKISADRWAANSEGADHWYQKEKQRKVRTASFGLPAVTPQRARAYGFSYQAWKRSMEAALSADYSRISEVGRRVRGFFDDSDREVRVTAKNGTDLTFRLAKRKSWIDDGVLDDDDLAAGIFETTLPGGCLQVAPDENSANGKVVFDLPIPQRGKLIRGLSWTFEDGRIKEFSAAKNGEMILPVWNESTGDKDRFGWFEMGFNHAAKTGFLNNEIASGTVTIGVGENKKLGGNNESPFQFQGTLRKATVTVDGQTIVSEGKLTV